MSDGEWNLPLTIAGVVTTVAWLGAMGLVRLVRRPRDPVPGPPTDDLPPEPPALANLLVRGFRVTREAVAATVLDLAARGALEVEGGEHEGFRVRPRRPLGGRPASYEARVLDLVRSKAVGGVVPTGALTTGPKERSRAWWRGFRKEVVADAQARGLCRDLWDVGTMVALALAAAVPAILLGIGAPDFGAGIAYWIFAAAFLAIVHDRGRQRDTDAGLEAAGAWLGVRRHLREATTLPDLPPTAVVVWERLLAAAAALGVADAAVRPLAMGADPDRRAWSSHGGVWREVRVRYPWRIWPPGWGWRPGVAFLVALGTLAAAGLVTSGLARIPLGSFPDVPGGFVSGLRVARVVLLTLAGLVLAWGAALLVRAVADLGATRRVDGLVLRARAFESRRENGQPRRYVALDDGTAGAIRAWRVSSEVYAAAPAEAHGATAHVTPRLGFVRSIAPTGG